MRNFEYEFRKSYLKELWEKSLNYNSIAIYGAGSHTNWFLSFIRIPENIKLCIIDDYSDVKTLCGINVYRSDEAQDIDLVFISSDTKENLLIDNAKNKFPDTKIIAPYSTIGPGPYANFSKRELDSSKSITQWKDLYKGERCFVLGNGPSLNKLDLKLLKNEFTFGANRIYLNYNKMGFETSFLVCINEYVIRQFKDDFQSIQCPKFFPLEYKSCFKEPPEKSFFLPYQSPLTPCFHLDLSKSIWWGATVTYVSIQLAYYMGFQEVYLIGVDHCFKDQGSPNQLVKFDKDDNNHFDPSYFKGYEWQLPDLQTSELSYRIAEYTFRKSGRVIKDATYKGKLNIFDKINYSELFKKSVKS